MKKSNLNNKSMAYSMEFLVKLIVISIVLLIIVVFVNKWENSANNAAHSSSCKTSVAANAALHMKDLDLGNDMNTIYCPTTVTNFKKKDSDTKIKKEMAESMRRCWDNFGEGKLVLFEGDGIYCTTCAYFDFEKEDEKIEDFVSYLYDTTIPNNKKLSYMSYLQSYETDNAKRIISDVDKSKYDTVDNDLYIDTSKEYGTFFIYAKGKDEIKQVTSTLQGSVESTGSNVFIAGGLMLLASGTALELGIVSAPVGFVMQVMGGIAWFGGAVWAGVEGHIKSDDYNAQMSFVLLREYKEEELRQFNCTFAPSAQS